MGEGELASAYRFGQKSPTRDWVYGGLFPSVSVIIMSNFNKINHRQSHQENKKQEKTDNGVVTTQYPSISVRYAAGLHIFS